MSMGRPRSRPRRLNALCLGKMIRYWQDVPSTVLELAEAGSLSEPTVRRFVLSLEHEGAIHVVGWEQDSLGRYTTKVYAFGPGQDVAKPKPARSRDVCRRDQRARELQIATQNAIAGVQP